ncbi:MAG TPA: stage 0 sporulation protein, partial [Clostridiales bacterium]|nr:stage 0 sporulation protein [Clostridiales bacterium]
DPVDIKLEPQDNVIVETARGSEFGTVAIGNKQVEEREVISPLKKVIRIATAADEKKVAENRKIEKRAADVWEKKITEHTLDMTLVDV